MGRNGRKRSHDEYNADNAMSMGSTVARLRHTSDEESSSRSNSNPKDHNESGDWQYAESHRSKKKKKKQRHDAESYPTFTHSPHNRLQTFVKLGDLQNLVLLLLADGPSQQWCTVKHHHHVRKVVALMVPGLEAGMFDGTLPLSSDNQQETEAKRDTTADSAKLVHETSNVKQDTTSTTQDPPFQVVQQRKLHVSPDDFYPKRLIHDRLPIPPSTSKSHLRTCVARQSTGR
jgi:RNA exonuclease 1